MSTVVYLGAVSAAGQLHQQRELRDRIRRARSGLESTERRRRLLEDDMIDLTAPRRVLPNER